MEGTEGGSTILSTEQGWLQRVRIRIQGVWNMVTWIWENGGRRGMVQPKQKPELNVCICVCDVSVNENKKQGRVSVKLRSLWQHGSK